MPDIAQFEQLAPGTQPDEEEVAAYRQHVAEFVQASATLCVRVPMEMWLGALRDGRLRVVAPFHVSFSREHDHMIAEALEVDEFGFGNNLSEALADLQRALAALYFSLEEEQQRLGPDLERVWQTMRLKIARRP